MTNKKRTHNDQAERREAAGIAKAIREHAAMTHPESPEEFKKRDRKHLCVQWTGVVIAAMYAGLTLWLLLTTRQAVSLTREQVHIGQRAYLLAHHAVLTEQPAAGKKLHASIDVTNYGQTPALNVSYWLNFLPLPTYPETVTYGPILTPAVPIGANQTVGLKSGMLQPLTEGEAAEITTEDFSLENNLLKINGGTRLFLYGIVRYVDVFGQPAESEFCVAYVAMESAFQGCRSHNDIRWPGGQ